MHTKMLYVLYAVKEPHYWVKHKKNLIVFEALDVNIFINLHLPVGSINTSVWNNTNVHISYTKTARLSKV